MKIEVDGRRIASAVKKLEGIDLVLESAEDAHEALELILKNPGLFQTPALARLRELRVEAHQKYETSAVEYIRLFRLEFLFEEGTPLEEKVAVIKEIQAFLGSA